MFIVDPIARIPHWPPASRRAWILAGSLLGLVPLACGDDDAEPAEQGTGDSTSTTTDLPPMGDSTHAPATDSTTTLGDTEAPATTGDEELCGNGRVDPGEVCDDGINDGSYGGCVESCLAFAPSCGDGTVDAIHGETCDLGSDNGGIECNRGCQYTGAIMAIVQETIVLDPRLSTELAGLEAALWQGGLAVAIGTPTPMVWEIDGETLETHALRSLSLGVLASGITGVAAQPSGDLLITSSSYPELVVVDDALLVQHTIDELDLPAFDYFVGAAATEGGTMLGGQYRLEGPGAYSAFWVAAISDDGQTLWSDVDLYGGNSNIDALDFGFTGDGRGVLLTAGLAGGATTRVYGPAGNVIANQNVAMPSGLRRICPGSSGFYLAGIPLASAVGFDSGGTPTQNVNVSFAESEFGLDCVTRDDGWPFIVYNANEVGTVVARMLLTIGPVSADYLVLDPSTEFDLSPTRDPVVVLESEQHRAWVVLAGSTPSDDAVVLIAVLIAV